MKSEDSNSRSESVTDQRDLVNTGSVIGPNRFMSGDTNFDTMMETPNALRFVSTSYTEGSEEGENKKRRKRKKNQTGQQGCCVAGADGGKNCSVM